MFRAIFHKDTLLFDRCVGHDRITSLFALGLATGTTPWLASAASLARADERRHLFDGFLGVQVVLAAILLPWITAKLMKAERGGRAQAILSLTAVPPAWLMVSKLMLLTLVAGELALVSIPLVVLQYELGMASPSGCVVSQLEFLSFIAMTVPVGALIHLALDRPLSALGATYLAVVALGLTRFALGAAAGPWIAGWLAVATVGTGLVILQSRRRYLYASV